jgi:hypothetical protein
MFYYRKISNEILEIFIEPLLCVDLYWIHKNIIGTRCNNIEWSRSKWTICCNNQDICYIRSKSSCQSKLIISRTIVITFNNIKLWSSWIKISLIKITICIWDCTGSFECICASYRYSYFNPSFLQNKIKHHFS